MIRCKLFALLLACTYCSAISMVERVQNDYLFNNVITHLDERINNCEDPYSYVCGKTDVTGTNEYSSLQYTDALRLAEYILSSNDTHGYQSIAVEQELYKECLRYGVEDGKALKEIREKVKIFESLLLDIIIKNIKWQKVDHKIEKLGLGNAFFNIKVVRDPVNSRKNIIMLEPPSLLALNNLRITLENISQYDLYSSEWPNETLIISVYKIIKTNGFDLIREFVASLIKAIEETSSLDRTKILSEKMTIAEWSKKYNRKSTSPIPTTEINWPEIIFHEFYKVNINLYDSEPLIVKNIHYFSRLFNTLLETPNDIIGATVVAKAASENLRYIDFELAQYLHNRDRSIFCRTETKLYGVSHKILFDLCKDAIYKKQTFKIQEIVYNILEVVKSAIHEASFSFAEESYLLTELQDITSHLRFLAELQYIDNNEGLETWSPLSLPEYYESFNRSSSYFNNIINYRQMLKMKELRSLKSRSNMVDTPFSLVDLSIPANRFILNVFFDRVFFQNNYYKEQVFGTYGVKLATLVYGLLNENKAIDNSYYDHSLSAHPDFVFVEINCVDSNNIAHTEKTNKIISSSVGLDIAFNALGKPVLNKVDMPSLTDDLPFKKVYVWKSDQIFFLAYSLAHCYLTNSTLNDIISHSTKFSVSFPNCQTSCKYQPFTNVDKNIFLIKM